MSGYTTLASAASAEFTERKSRFIGYCSPVTTEREALDFISSIRSKHSDATHNVWAYCLREMNISRFSDDGEPHGTAGLPVLEALRKPEITDAVIVVTRYFGGILLGAGGLVRAYTAAAVKATEVAGKAIIRQLNRLQICVSYPDYARITPIIEASGCKQISCEFGEAVILTLLAEPAVCDELAYRLSDATAGRAVPKLMAVEYGAI